MGVQSVIRREKLVGRRPHFATTFLPIAQTKHRGKNKEGRCRCDREQGACMLSSFKLRRQEVEEVQQTKIRITDFLLGHKQSRLREL